MGVHHRLHFGPRFIKPGMDENLSRRHQVIWAIEFVAVEIDGDHLVGRGVSHPGFARAAGPDQCAVGTRNSGAEVACCRLGQVQLANYPTGLRHAFRESLDIGHVVSTPFSSVLNDPGDYQCAKPIAHPMPFGVR